LCEITAIRKFFTCTQCADVLLLLILWCQCCAWCCVA
jgi:hypothetical protein